MTEYAKFIDPKTAQRVGKGLAAQFILSGGYTLAGDTIRVDARVFNVETGAVLTSQRVEGKKDEFFALAKAQVTGSTRKIAWKTC